MHKQIKSILITSLVLFSLSIYFVGLGQWYLFNDDASSERDLSTERQEFVKTTDDIEKLRQVSILLLDNNYEYKKLLEEVMESARYTFIFISILVGAIIFQALKAKKSLSNKDSTPKVKNRD